MSTTGTGHKPEIVLRSVIKLPPSLRCPSFCEVDHARHVTGKLRSAIGARGRQIFRQSFAHT
jgi:hypothetical protein